MPRPKATFTLIVSLFALILTVSFLANCRAAFAFEEGYAARFDNRTPDTEYKRTSHSIHFKNPDGSISAYLSMSPINYLGTDGKYHMYDVTPNDCALIEYRYSVTETDLQTYFPVNSSGWVQVNDLNGRFMRWQEIGLYHVASNGNKTLISYPSVAAPLASGSSVTYSALYSGIDCEYLVDTGKLKHNYVFPAMPGFLAAYFDGSIAVAVKLQLTSGCSLYSGSTRITSYLSTGGALSVRSASGLQLFDIPAPFAAYTGIQLDGEQQAASYEVVPDGADYILYTTLPVSYMKDSLTKYPLMLDPSLVLSISNTDPTKYEEQGFSFNTWYRAATMTYGGVWVSPYVGPWIGSYDIGTEPCSSANVWKTVTINPYAYVTSVETRLYQISNYGIVGSGHYVDFNDFKLNIFAAPFNYDGFAAVPPPPSDGKALVDEVSSGTSYLTNLFSDYSAPGYYPSNYSWLNLGSTAVSDFKSLIPEGYFGYGLQSSKITGSGQRLGRITECNNTAQIEKCDLRVNYIDTVRVSLNTNISDILISIDGVFQDTFPVSLDLKFGYRTFSTPSEYLITFNKERWHFSGWSFGAANASTTFLVDENFTDSVVFANYTFQYYFEVVSSEGNVGGADTGWYAAGSSINTFITGTATQTIDTRRIALGWTADGSAPPSGGGFTIPPFPLNLATRVVWQWEIQFRLTMTGAISGFLPGYSADSWIPRDEHMIGVGVNPWTQIGGGTRKYATGWTGSGSVEPGLGNVMTDWTMSKPSIVNWNYEIRYELAINSAQGGIKGDTANYYAPGSLINTAIEAFVTNSNNDKTRYNARTWTALGSLPSGSGQIIPTFALNTPSYITWNWTTQHQLHITSLFGTLSPPDLSWFDSGMSVEISASVPANSNQEEYTWVGWLGVGDGSINGGDPTDTIIINEPITMTATWYARFFLFLDPGLGTILNMSTVSNWYEYDERVAIQAMPPGSVLDTRYILGWQGQGDGAYNADPRIGADTVIFIRILGPTTQKANWVSQYKVRVRNTMTIGNPQPPVGDYWVSEGELFYGSVMPNVRGMLSNGYTATGSIVSSALPIFSAIITEPSLVSWLWKEGVSLPMKNWDDSILLAQGFRGRNIVTHISPDGSIVAIAFYSQELRQLRCHILSEGKWNQYIIATGENIGAFIDMQLDANANPHVAYFDGVRREVRYARFVQETSKAGIGAFITEVIEVGDYGRSMTMRLGSNGEPRIIYYDELFTDVRFLERTSEGWLVHPIVTPNDIGFYCTLALTPIVDVPQVAFIDSTENALKYAVYENNMWNISVLDATANITGPLSMAIDIGGRPFIGYQVFTYPSRHTYRITNEDETGWHYSAVVDESADSVDAAFLIDNLGYIHFVYNNSDSLAYLRYDGLQWERNNLDLGPGNKWMVDINLTLDENIAVFFWKGNDLRAISMTGFELKQDTYAALPPPALPDDGGDDPNASTGSSGGCFIATAAFGSLAQSTVTSLCDVRDNVLTSSTASACLVALYYTLSPSPASAIAKSSTLRCLIRDFLSN